jgi:hypothetical protein
MQSQFTICIDEAYDYKISAQDFDPDTISFHPLTDYEAKTCRGIHRGYAIVMYLEALML